MYYVVHHQETLVDFASLLSNHELKQAVHRRAIAFIFAVSSSVGFIMIDWFWSDALAHQACLICPPIHRTGYHWVTTWVTTVTYVCLDLHLCTYLSM